MSTNTSTGEFIVGDPEIYRGAYSAPGVVSNFHGLPRGSSGTDEFSILFSGSDTEKESYVRGLFYVGAIMACLFLVWALMLLILKCLGKRRVGFMSGSSFSYYDAGALVRYVRFVFIGSAIMVILFACLLVGKGTTQLEEAADVFHDSNEHVVTISGRLAEISTKLQTDANEAIDLRDQLSTFLKQDICPTNPGTDLEATLRSLSESTLTAVEQLENFVQSDLQELDTVLDDIQDGSEDIDTLLGDRPTTFQVAAIVIPFVIITSALLLALGLSWKIDASPTPPESPQEVPYRKFFCLVDWLVLPLFVLLILAAIVGCAASSFIAEANADACSGGQDNTPEATVSAIAQSEFDNAAFEYEFISFYVDQCTSPENPLEFLDEYIVELAVAKENLNLFIKDIEDETVEVISQVCGVDFNTPMNLLRPMNVLIDELLVEAWEGVGLIGCNNLVPIYRQVMHDGTCTSAMQAESWIFSSLLLISFFGMLMIMLRAAYQPTTFYDDAAGDDDASDSKRGTATNKLDSSERSGSATSMVFGNRQGRTSSEPVDASWDEALQERRSNHKSRTSVQQIGRDYEMKDSYDY